MTEQNKSQVETPTTAVVKQDKTPVQSLFPSFPSREDWNTMEIIAKTFLNAGAMPKGIDTAPKLMVILQAGREAGLSPIEALNSLYFVNGKVAMYGDAVPLQIYRAGHAIEWGECSAETATVTITRGDTGKSMSQTFTMEEAQKRGYTSNPVYQKYPENMLKWRVLGMTAKFICPDALRGIGIKEEMEAEIIQHDSKFRNDEAGKGVHEQIADGSFAKRPLDAALDAPDETKPETVGHKCTHKDCDKVLKTKAGLTKHLSAMHLEVKNQQGETINIT